MSQSQVVISQRKGRGRLILQIVLVCAALIGIVLAYEFGLSRAGFSRVEALKATTELEERNQQLQQQNKEFSERVAILETAEKVDKEAYSQVEIRLQELQGQILQQQEDIEFYKGIVNENDGTGLRIQDFQVSAGVGPGRYELRLVLAQAFRSTRQVAGKVEMVVEGMRDGEVARLGLSELADPAAGESPASLDYAFKYFQDMKAEVVLPAGFEPERIRVVVRPKGNSSKTVEDIFVWEEKAG